MTISQIQVGDTTHDITLPGLTASVKELNYVDGATSNIQNQINTIGGMLKEYQLIYSDTEHTNTNGTLSLLSSGVSLTAPEISDETGLNYGPRIASITSSDGKAHKLTATIDQGNSVVVSDTYGYFTSSGVSTTELGNLQGTTGKIQTQLNNITSNYETKASANTKLNDAKTYADNAAKAVKDSLLGGAGAAYDTLKELADLIQANDSVLDALQPLVENKVKIHFWESGD